MSKTCWPLSRPGRARVQIAETEEQLLEPAAPVPPRRRWPDPRGAPLPQHPPGRLSTGQPGGAHKEDAVVTDLSPLAPERCPRTWGWRPCGRTPAAWGGRLPSPVGKTWRATREGTSRPFPGGDSRGRMPERPPTRSGWRAPLGPRRRRHQGRLLGQRPHSVLIIPAPASWPHSCRTMIEGHKIGSSDPCHTLLDRLPRVSYL